MPTPFDDIYAAALAIMVDVDTAATGTIAQAPTNYGLDFRITPAQAVFQVHIEPERDHGSSNANWPRAIVSIMFHHYVTTLANEKEFLHDMMSHVADNVLKRSVWRSKSGIYDWTPEEEPELTGSGRIGNVISFEASIDVLANAV